MLGQCFLERDEEGTRSATSELPLWGVFKPVRLYLELEKGKKSLKRFIIWVHHPQFFVRSGFFRLRPEARRAYGEAEDLALTVARSLVGDGTNFTVNYFQTRLLCHQGNQMTREQQNLFERNNELLQKAFKWLFLSSTRSVPVSERRHKRYVVFSKA